MDLEINREGPMSICITVPGRSSLDSLLCRASPSVVKAVTEWPSQCSYKNLAARSSVAWRMLTMSTSLYVRGTRRPDAVNGMRTAFNSWKCIVVVVDRCGSADSVGGSELPS